MEKEMKIFLPDKKGIKQPFRLYLNEVKQVLPSKRATMTTD